MSSVAFRGSQLLAVTSGQAARLVAFGLSVANAPQWLTAVDNPAADTLYVSGSAIVILGSDFGIGLVR